MLKVDIAMSFFSFVLQIYCFVGDFTAFTEKISWGQEAEKEGFQIMCLCWYRLVVECLSDDHVKGGGGYKSNNPLTTNTFRIMFFLFSEIHILTMLDC